MHTAMSNPDDDYTNPTFSGEVYLTVCVTYDDHECYDQDTLESDTVHFIQSKLQHLGGVSVAFEDSDLYITNEKEGYLEEADRKYEQLNDK